MLSKQGEIPSINTSEVDFRNLLFYWNHRLTGASPLLELPFDIPRSSQTSSSKANFEFLLPKLLCDDLKDLGRKSETNMMVVLLAAFKTLLYRYTNQADILIGFPDNIISNLSESSKLVDVQLDKMFFRTDLSDDPGFLTVMERVSKTVLEAEIHKALPSDILMEYLRTIGLHVDSLFQIVFEFCDTGVSDCRTTAQRERSTTPMPDIHLSIEETRQGLAGQWKYNSALFKESTIKRIASHFLNLLLGIVANPDQPISKLPLLSSSERLQILFEWNNTFTEYPEDKCIHELFEQQVKRTPDAVAVEDYEVEGISSTSSRKSLTYYQLNKRADQLAHYLSELGIVPDVLVGVCLKRSPDMMVALLGILKAGGAYLPLDPGYPKERLQFMLKDSCVPVLLTEQQLLKELPSHSTKVVCIDSDWDKIAQCDNKNLVSVVKPENLAYVIYTSGSTGTPKGTMIIHRGVVNYLNWCIKKYAVADGSGAPINSSIAFDATVTSFFAPLLTGKRVLLLPEKEEIEALSAVLVSSNCFSLVKITPAHLEILRHLLSPDQVKNQVNVMVIGGEALQAKSLDLWRNHAPDTRLINEYGPTETVVGCCTYEVPNKSLLSDNIPIGRPIANTQIYILDRHMEPVPIGVLGEIYIGGAGLARGYLNRPDLTKQCFVFNPFTDDPHARLYKTGDLGRYMPDGNIIFQGRIDHQVKIRGYRIELGEIESVLANHPSVQQVVVLVREDYPGDKRLVAYMVIKDQTCTINDLRLHVSKKLPEYMLPAVFVFLQYLPLTSNGKVDRGALPIPDQQKARLEKTYTAPRDTIEQHLVEIFQECLNIQRIGITDDFFELGGSSIQAAVIFSKIRKAMGKQFPLSTLIQLPTIEKLAPVIRGERKETNWSCLVPIQSMGSKPPLFCMHAGAGTVLFYRSLATHLGSDQPLYGLQAKGLNGNETPHTRIEDMATHYIREIRALQAEGPYYLAGYCLGAILAFEMAQQLKREGYEVALLVNFNGVSPTCVHLRNGVVIKENDEKEDYNKKAFPIASNHAKKRKVAHFKARSVYASKLVIRIMKFHLRKLAYRFFLALNRPLPESLGKIYYLETNGMIAKAYVPQVYLGRMLIFYSPGIYNDPTLGWSNLAKDGITSCIIPGNHKTRREIMNEPFVQILAHHLKNHLEQNQ